MNEENTYEIAAQEPSGVDGWAPPKSRPTHLAEPALKEWENLTAKVREVARLSGMIKTDVAKRADMPLGTFSPWYDGTYSGNYTNQATKIRNFLRAHEETIAANAAAIEEPEWVDTPTATSVVNALSYAQQAPAMATITLGSGMGKTTCAKRYAQTHPNAYRVVLRPSISSVSAVLREVAKVLGIQERDPNKLPEAIGEKVKRNGKRSLLMIDEAQWATDRAVNELRFFLDEYGCGLALLGNDEVNSRFGSTTPKEGMAQIHRRTGARIRVLKPTATDISMFVAAWGFEDLDVVRLLKVIGGKPGYLGQVTETIKLASILAAGAGRPIDAAAIRQAWDNRASEEVR